MILEPAPDDGGFADRESADGESAEGAPVLDPAVRAQVIAVAADVVGRMPVDDVPQGLRTIARFAPAKRQRLGASALAAALDNDPGFRAVVADVVERGSPELVASLRAGTVPAAAEPIDVAIVAYLARPDGWAGLLAAANRRMDAEKGAPDDQVETLRAQVAELRRQARGESARTRVAVADAEARSAAEIAQLRATLRDRTRALRAAERELAEERTAAAEANGRQDRRASGLEAELRRVGSRLAEAERALEAARRETRTGRDVDDARLWLLVDTLVQAAAGVRRELSLPAPQLRPGDTLAAGRDPSGETAGRRMVDEPAGLDRLLALPHAHLIVDGYNVTKTGYPQLPLADQRTRLIHALAALAGRRGVEITIAFDGGQRPPAQPAVPRGVRVLFSAADEIADDLIRRLVDAEPEGRATVVVSSDRAVADDTRRSGAWTADSRVLLGLLERSS